MGLLRAALLSSLLMTGCSAAQEKPALSAVLAHDSLRAQTFEATARVLDEHPDYVDEFYAIARKHPRLLNRFLANTARDLREEALARPTAKLLAQNPAALELILVDTVQESQRLPKARAATARAVAREHTAMADATTDSPVALKTTMMASVDFALVKEPAREAMLEAMRERAPELAIMLMHDPATLKVLMEAMSKQAADKAVLANLLRSFW